MKSEEIIQYYDYLMRLAVSKCASQTDAEDLVGDTLLAAFGCLHKGGIIEHPKTWLSNTLFHKYHDALRRKYRYPVTVCLDDVTDLSEEEDEPYFTSEEASEVRKALNFLGRSTREVLIRFYFGNQSVSDIAEALDIPEGTVKSRLSAGRSQMKKGLKEMEKNNRLPGELHLSYGGRDGLRGEPLSLVEDDLIAQNLLILAYEKPVTVSELSRAIGIPAAYVEPIVQKLVGGELLAKTEGGRVYSDFIITKPQDTLRSFEAQLDFAHRHFDTVWGIVQKMSEQISAMPFVQEMGMEEKTKLDRYAVLKALQDMQFYITGTMKSPKFPKRRDGGQWAAQGTAFEAGYDAKKYAEVSEYRIHGGHRISASLTAGGTRLVRLYEFDTSLLDCPCRYGFSWELYFKHVVPLLWCICADIPPEEWQENEIPSELIANIPALFRYNDATACFAMAIVREAYGRGLHLKDVAYCCPPVVMSIECSE